MKTKHIIFLLFILVSAAAQAQVAAAAQGQNASAVDLNDAIPLDPALCTGRLDNGFTYYIRDNHMPENAIHLRLVVNAGSILEEESQRGLAHFCEHMAFNGIEGFPHNQLTDTLQKCGIEFGRDINASTSYDQTIYFIDLPADSPALLDLCFQILDGWSHGQLFDPQELDDERGVIHEEWRRKLGADDRLRQATLPVILKGSRYAQRHPIGLESVIMGFRRDDIVSFYRDWYRPDLEAVVVVGDIPDLDAMEARIRSLFGRLPKAENSKPRPEHFGHPDNRRPLVAIATDPEATGTSLACYWKHDDYRDSTVGDLRGSLTRSLVSYMIRDRLTELAAQPDAPFLAAGGSFGYFMGRGNSAFSLYANPKNNQAAAAAETLFAEAYRAVQHGFTQSELDREKGHLLHWADWRLQNVNANSNGVWAGRYTYFYLEGGSMPSTEWNDSIERLLLPGISLDECNDVLRSWITANNFLFCLTAPDSVAVPTEKEVLRLLKQARKAHYAPYDDGMPLEPFWDKELPDVEPLVVARDSGAIGYTEYRCPNGIRFLVKPTTFEPGEVMLISTGKGGTSLYPDEEAFAVQESVRLIGACGVGSYNKVQLERYRHDKLFALFPQVSDYSQYFSGNCSSRNLEQQLQMLNLFYLAPRCDSATYSRLLDERRAEARQACGDPQQLLAQAFRAACYPADRRKVVIPTEQQFDSLTLDRAYAYFRQRFNDAGNQTFVFVGDLTEQDIPLIAKYLNNLPVSGAQRNEESVRRPRPFAEGIQHQTVAFGTAPKGTLRLYGQTPHYEQTRKNDMIVSQLGECLQINATEVIREQMGSSYALRAAAGTTGDADTSLYWSFYVDCNPAQMPQVEAAALGILQGYIDRGPSAETLAKVQQQLLANHAEELRSNIFWVNVLLSHADPESEPADYLVTDYQSLVSSVSAADIQAFCARYFNLGNYVSVGHTPAK